MECRDDLLNLKRNLELDAELSRILSRLDGSGIEAIPLKGTALAKFIYGDVSLRPAPCDIDILVRREKVRAAEGILEDMGYSFCIPEEKIAARHEFNTQINLWKQGSGILLDLQWALRDRFTPSHIEDFWKNARYASLDGQRILMPSTEDLLLYLALSAMSDFDFVQLKYIYDMHSLVMKSGKAIDWKVALEGAKKNYLTAPLFFSLSLSEDFFGTDIPDNILQALRPNVVKEKFLRCWINRKNILHRREEIASSYMWRHQVSSYLLSRNFPECLRAIFRKAFLPMEEVMVERYNRPASKRSVLLYLKRLTRPIGRIFRIRRAGWLRYLFPFLRVEVLMLTLNICAVVLGLANPYLAKLMIDRAYQEKSFGLFLILTAAMGVTFLLSSLITSGSNYLSRRVKFRLNFDLNRRLFKNLYARPYSFFQDTSASESLYKMSYDVEQFSRFAADILPQTILLVPKLLLIIAIVFCLDRRMALAATALAPLLYITPYYFMRRVKNAFKAWVEHSQGIFRRLHEAFGNIQLIKAFGKEKAEERRYVGSLIENLKAGLRNIRLEAGGGFSATLAGRALLGFVVFYGGFRVIKGEMTLGTLSAVAIYLSQLYAVQGALAHLLQQAPLGLVSYERIGSILESGCEPGRTGRDQDAHFAKGAVEFRNVRFAYSKDKPVLRDLSFTVGGGSRVALVGPSGCGKTTIVSLIVGLYSPEAGRISIDGFNIRNIRRESLYGQIGVALQRPFLWNDTIENNIRYGRDGASREDVMDAGRIACVEDFVNNLPKRYSTVIGETGCRVSEGEKQRIAIARAVVKRPRILILDEALSSIDAATEARIIENIRGALGSSTVIVVSHRASTIEEMDLVYFLTSPGEICAGQHQELLRGNAAYQNYLASQAGVVL